MIKKCILYATILAGTIAASCNDWLDVTSKTEVVDYELLSNEKGFMDAMAGVYYAMANDALYGKELTIGFLDVLANRFDFSIYQNFSYSKDLGTGGYYENENIKKIIDAIWLQQYNAIANLNNLLGQIDESKNLFLDNNYNLIKGEALGLRAFLHFDLLRMFAPSYAVDPNAKAIPYVKVLDGKTTVPLSTTTEVLSAILADLYEAKELLATDQLTATSIENPWQNDRKSHFNRYAVYATLARAYHYMNDKEKAHAYADSVINADALTFFDPASSQSVSNNGQLRDIMFYSESVFALPRYEGWEDLWNNVFKSNFNSMLMNDSTSLVSIYEIASGGSSDYRYSWNWSYDQEAKVYTCYKYYQSMAIHGNLMPLIRLPEMYYIAAECCGNTPEGREYLNTVRKNRGIILLGEDLDDESFEQEIFKEYQKEFYYEGQLFYYYKRLNKAYMIKHDNINTISSDAPGYVFPIPEEEGYFHEESEDSTNEKS